MQGSADRKWGRAGIYPRSLQHVGERAGGAADHCWQQAPSQPASGSRNSRPLHSVRWHLLCCRHGSEPYVVHATFQRFSTQVHFYGKRARFRCARGRGVCVPGKYVCSFRLAWFVLRWLPWWAGWAGRRTLR